MSQTSKENGIRGKRRSIVGGIIDSSAINNASSPPAHKVKIILNPLTHLIDCDINKLICKVNDFILGIVK